MGDYGEFIVGNDPRFDIGVISDWVKPDDIVESQRKWIKNLLSPIKGKCLGLLEGNHEDSIRLHFKGDVQQHICDDLGVPNLGYSCFTDLVFRRGADEANTFTALGHFEHGSGNAVTKGWKLNLLHKSMLSFDGILHGRAHHHDIITDSLPYMTLDKTGRIKQKVKVGAITGCWFRTYSQGIRASYGEKKGYPPTRIGCPVFTIRPFRGEIEVTD